MRIHPAVTDTLNDLAIADFLLFDMNQDAATTSFTHILQIPAAHRATWSATRTISSRYWTLPIEEPIYFKRSDEYVEQFKESLNRAVGDRLRTARVSIFMSGGIDSPLLAAAALDLLSNSDSVHAFTCVFEKLIPDSERHYAGLVASQLGIPIQFFVIDDQAAWATPRERITPEPHSNLASPRMLFRYYAAANAFSRVAFYGKVLTTSSRTNGGLT